MKRIIPGIFIICFAISANAQKEGNIWCFGTGIGLNFNAGYPVFFPVAKIDAWEGSSSIADTNGNLLFYTDGHTVWNRNQQPMPNGVGLMGATFSNQSGTSCTQAAVIVPQPGSSSIYYVFTTPERQSAADGFRYSIVDMTLQGGLGDVTTMNALLFTPSSEKISATLHSNKTDVWVAGYIPGNNIIRAYKLTSSGVDTNAVLSKVGDTLRTSDSRAQMKFSIGGKYLGVAFFGRRYNQLFNFNNTTGVFSNPIKIHHTPQDTSLAYGLEFSPDESKLYINHFLDETEKKVMVVSQFDLSSGDSTIINNSKIQVGPISMNGGAGIGTGLQLGPDNKVYCNTKYRGTYIDVINNPNASGAACNYQVAGVSTAPALLELSLPTMFMRPNTNVQAHFNTVDTVLCVTGEVFPKCISFTNFSYNSTSYQWYFPGATPSSDTATNPANICYPDTGDYTVILVASNGIQKDSLSFNKYVRIHNPPTLPSIAQSSDTLFAPQGYSSYVWTYNGTIIPLATNYFYAATQSGSYTITVIDANHCSATATLDIITSFLQTGQPDFKIYPNPITAGELTIHYPSASFNARLINSVGQIVAEKKGAMEMQLPVADLANGIYTLQLVDDQKSSTVKVIIQH